MADYYTVSEYAVITGKDPGNIRRNLIKGKIRGEKIGNQWVIPCDEEYPNDRRVKTGRYRNWRKAIEIRKKNSVLMNALSKMCKELEKLYGDDIERVVLYGSYARGDETIESDVDIAVFLKTDDSEERHDKMTDIIVDYELEQGVTLSVIQIEKKQYDRWHETSPFYRNIEREGIVLWKTA